MKIRGLHVAALAFAVAFSGCTSLGSYPSEWHGTSDAIHVYVADAATAIEIPATGGDVTVLDAVFHAGLPVGDLTNVVLYRRAGSEMLRLAIDVREMVRTGNNSSNILLQAGDVIGIAG